MCAHLRKAFDYSMITGTFLCILLGAVAFGWMATQGIHYVYTHGGDAVSYTGITICALYAIMLCAGCIEFLVYFAKKHEIVSWPTDGGCRVEDPDAPPFKTFSPLEFAVLCASIGADYATRGWKVAPYTSPRCQLNQYDWKRVLMRNPPKQLFLASYNDTYATIQNIYGTDSMRGGMIAATRTTFLDRIFFLGPQHLVVFPSGLVVITHRKGLWW